MGKEGSIQSEKIPTKYSHQLHKAGFTQVDVIIFSRMYGIEDNREDSKAAEVLLGIGIAAESILNATYKVVEDLRGWTKYTRIHRSQAAFNVFSEQIDPPTTAYYRKLEAEGQRLARRLERKAKKKKSK